MKLIREITFDYARVQLMNPKLIRIEITSEDIVITRDETKDMNDAIGVLSEGKEIPVMILATENAQFDSGSREFSASEEGFRFTKKEALIIRSLGQRILADFYLKINKPKKPCRTFNTEEDAIEWLLEK
ncbi:MAG: hypothetical protein K0S12_1804 [Bacteroidetes bacterium]|jgi:hypothetical protein|nr:hypothetical protein [Bacteroidota bacterium]